MRLLTGPSGDTFTICTDGSLLSLWNKITFTELLRYELLCNPFKLNGCWAAALRGSFTDQWNGRSVWWE